MIKKILIIALISCLCFMCGCSETPETNNYEQINEADFYDTFWVAEEFVASDSEEAIQMPYEGWNVDLFLYEAGAARFRSVKNNVYTEGSEIFTDAAWTINQDTGELIISVMDSEETLIGYMLDGKFHICGYDGTYIMEQSQMPENGAEWSPADLEGTWKLLSSEIEGYEATAEELGMEGYIAFYASGEGLSADYYLTDQYGNETSVFSNEVTYEEMALYDGCENEAWSVAFSSADGMTECYATIFNRDTLRLLIFNYIEGREYPAMVLQSFLWQGNGSAVG